MTNRHHFDYIIIGHGLAGLQLALKLASDAFFNDKHIALIDPSEKNTNDKTWSFWETEPSQWDGLVYKSWNKATVVTSKKSVDLKLKPYRYKSIRAIDFYTQTKTKLQNQKNIHFIKETAISVEENNQIIVKTEQNTYTCNHVFDSRIEFTYFTENVVNESVYDNHIETYITKYLKIENYTVVETEMGQIPMTNFPFDDFNTKQITKIGTGGGWVKGSTGYSFKSTEKKIALIIENLKAGKTPSLNLFKRKYKFYDKVFLKVLKDENHKGEWIFQQFYDKNSIQTMFRFLDEESSFFEEVKIMWSLLSWSFIKAFIKTL